MIQTPKDIQKRMQAATLPKRLRWRLEFAAYITLKRVSECLSLPMASKVGSFLGGVWASGLSRFFPIHQTMLTSLSAVFPTWSKAQHRRLAKACWKEWGRVLWEYPHLKILKQQPWRIRVKGQDVLDHLCQAAQRGQPTIFVSGHFSFFQAVPMAAARWGLHITQMYRRQSNPMISKDWEDIQLLAVSQIASRSVSGTRRLAATLARGKSAFLLFDQHIRPGFELPFLGHPAMTAMGPAVLAQRFGALLVFAYTTRLGPGEFQVTFCPPTPTEGAPEDIMARLNDQLGQAILAQPDHWMWCYRRWIFSRKKRYTSSHCPKPDPVGDGSIPQAGSI